HSQQRRPGRQERQLGLENVEREPPGRRRRDDTLEDLQQVVDELGAAHRLAHAAAKALTLAHEWWARTDRAVGGISGGSAVMRSSAQLARSPLACADAARSQAWLEPRMPPRRAAHRRSARTTRCAPTHRRWVADHCLVATTVSRAVSCPA